MILLLLFSNLLVAVFGGKILIVCPVSSKSEAYFFHPMARELAARGHEITMVTSFAASNANFTQIVTATPMQMEDGFRQKNLDLVEKRNLMRNKWRILEVVDISGIFERCHSTYQNKEFQQKILSRKPGDFDLIIYSAYMNICMFSLAHKFQVPFIFVSCAPIPNAYSSLSGNREPTSIVPFGAFTRATTDKMTFTERLLNAIVTATFVLLEQNLGHPMYTEIYRSYLGNNYPSSVEIEKNVSMMLSNSHFALNFPRPLTPDVVEIGGASCLPPKPLPKEIQEFISQGKDGFIYFSFGTATVSERMPNETRRIFTNVFSRLSQRVLWKWGKGDMGNMPQNVMLSQWLPQQDLLGHKDLRVFITHGGALSAMEAAWYGAPVIGIPLFLDQETNSFRMEQAGFGIELEFSELTEDKLEDAIRKILLDPKYKINAKRMSSLVRDQPQHPLDRAIYNIEYVLRHKGASQLRSAARDLNFAQFHSLDVFIVLILAIAAFLTISVGITVLIGKMIYQFCFITKSTSQIIKQKNN